MKLINLMSLTENKNQIRKIFEVNEVEIYSEVEITGHTAQTIKAFGWWHTESDLPIYSTLYFAIVPNEKAEKVMNAVRNFSSADPQHPPRAFQVPVEDMI